MTDSDGVSDSVAAAGTENVDAKSLSLIDHTKPSESLACWFIARAVDAGLQTRLEPFGIRREQLEMLSLDAAKQWTATFNPIEVTAKSLREIYEAAF